MQNTPPNPHGSSTQGSQPAYYSPIAPQFADITPQHPYYAAPVDRMQHSRPAAASVPAAAPHTPAPAAPSALQMLTKLTQDMAHVQRHLEQSTTVQTRADNLEQTLQQKNNEFTHLAHKYGQLQSSLSAEQKANELLRTQCQESHKQTSDVTAKLDKLKHEVIPGAVRVEQQRKEIQEQHTSLQAAYSKLQKEHAALQERYNQVDGERAELRERLAGFEAQSLFTTLYDAPSPVNAGSQFSNAFNRNTKASSGLL